MPGAVDAMVAMGWVIDGEDLVITQGKFMSMVEVSIATMCMPIMCRLC